MQKQTGSIMLVAGTCIGSGMIALPMLLAKLGIIPSILLMIATWLLMYFSSLVSVELSLQSGKGLALGALGRKFSGRLAELVGAGSFKILSYALIAVYIYAGSSVIQKMIESGVSHQASLGNIASLYAVVVGFIFLLPIKFIDYINRILFVCLLAVIAVLLVGLTSLINWNQLPLFSLGYGEISVWQIVIPVIFTSFGFQGSCHSFANYCNLNPVILKRALFWGSFIPMIVYIIWNSATLSVIYNENPEFYQQMIKGEVEVGDFVKQLSHIAKWQSIQLLVWWITILAIVTSVLGVGVGLFDSIKDMLPHHIKNNLIKNSLASIITILPAYLIAILVPNAFISVLGFAGMILVVIAILLPVYLFYKAKIIMPNYTILKSNLLLILTVIIGILIIIAEIFNVFS
jgi:tyrosine-specific transport protein